MKTLNLKRAVTFKKALTTCTALVISLFCTTSVFAETQVFVNGNQFPNIINKDGRVYVKLRDLSHYTGYKVEYDEINNTVNFYKGDETEEKPIIKRETSLFPSDVTTFEDGDMKKIIKVYELLENENPREISKEDFEQDGYIYRLTDITKNDMTSIDNKEHTEVMTIDTSSDDVNTILEQLPKEKEFKTADGYIGVLQLDMSTIKSEVKGYKSSSYTSTETREYPNLSSMDTSLIPKSISANGKTYTFADVKWQGANSTEVDYTSLSDTYKAVVKYTATGTKNTLTGYTTTAEYKGIVSKKLNGKVIYTAYFTGTDILPKEATVEELEQQLHEAKAREKAQLAAERAGNTLDFNVFWIFIPSLVIVALSAVIYLILFRKNVTVANLQGDEYKVIGKVRVTKKTPVIDLTDFAKMATNPTFLLTISYFTPKRLKDVRVVVNYGASSTSQDIIFDKLDKKGYQMQEIEF